MSARPTPDNLARFRAVSPIAHVERVAAPLLILLGGKDRRRARGPRPGCRRLPEGIVGISKHKHISFVWSAVPSGPA